MWRASFALPTRSKTVETKPRTHIFRRTAPSAGDVWFDWYNFNPDALPTIANGSFDYHTILHEVGHALGLKHSFACPNAIPAAQDNYFYSVMSYTASPWSQGDDYASFYPTTPMYYDLVAIQALYGKNTTINAGNNTYYIQRRNQILAGNQ